MKENQNHKKGVIIAVIVLIVLIAAGAIAYAFLAPKTVEGGWELIVNPETSQATPDETEKSSREKVFYIFSKPGEYGDGTFKTCYDGGVEEGEYKLSEKAGVRYINLGTEELVYTITGSKLFGSAKLTITFPEQTDQETGQTTPAQDYVFAQAKAPDYEKEAYSSFETDEAFIGEWIANTRSVPYYTYEIPYTQTVKIQKDGIMTIRYESSDLMLDRTMYFAYTAKNDALTFSLVTDKETQYTVSYTFDNAGNLTFTQDDTKDSIFSDAFFGDATYYTPEQLPEAVTPTLSKVEG